MQTPEQIKAEQTRLAEKTTAAKAGNGKASVPAVVAKGTAVALPETTRQGYLDEIAPASLVGRMIKYGKGGKYLTPDDEEEVGEDVDFIALCDQTLIGWIKFNGQGNPPDRAMGLLYDNWAMPARDTLGDDDPSQWETGLDGRPVDPWQHHIYLVLQNTETKEMFTFVTSSVTGRRAIGNLLRHYERMERSKSNAYPVIKLKVGGFQHRDDRVGWVATPVLAVVGRAEKDSAAKPDTSHAGDMSDSIPF